MEAGNVFVRIAQLQLLKNVVPHLPGGAGGEGRDGMIGKMRAQPAQLPVFGAEFVPPFRNAMRFVDGEKANRHALSQSTVSSRANRSGER